MHITYHALALPQIPVAASRVAASKLLLCRSSELSDADKASVRRMVSGAFQRVVATGGQTLGEVNITCPVLAKHTLLQS